ncbi:hypothetical protein J1N10_12820 [Carboxylicivirga sp. A043]|uniref:DUF6266 family protein n=1 Tax=Carboxylicivirga litoralis TaxID=2816963 RepID=UPI0021CB7705|nr:DUF6266 family protein [Carboxylicivirga sp. A043]MCU4156863.1 hypothetical protein [Carboxylicivirga sp. A043]
MAQVIDGINGQVKGKAGNSIFYTMYGKNFVRSRPDIARRRKPSVKQQAQRQRMGLVQDLLKPCKELIKLTFAPVTEGNAPYHVAKSYNLRHAIKGDTYPEQEIDWDKVYLSAGSVELPERGAVQHKGDSLLFSWSKQKGQFNDSLVVIALDKDLTTAQYRFTGVSRAKETFTWDMDRHGQQWHIWLAFRSNDEQDISNSLYLGLV